MQFLLEDDSCAGGPSRTRAFSFQQQHINHHAPPTQVRLGRNPTHAYKEGAGTVRQIRARFGVDYSSFSYRALNEGWDLRQLGICLDQKKDALRLSSRVKLGSTRSSGGSSTTSHSVFKTKSNQNVIKPWVRDP